MKYRNYIQGYDNFPKAGVRFWDFTSLTSEPDIFQNAIEDFAMHFSQAPITHIAAIEAKGFVIGAPLALKMKKPLVLIRKPHLIPGAVTRRDFEKEYGTGSYEIKHGTFTEGHNVLVVYDILAGPGATKAAINLIEEQNAQVSGCAFVIELEYLKGRETLGTYNLYSLVKIRTPKEHKQAYG